MTPARSRPLRQVLEMHRAVWDRDDTRSSVREAFAKVVDCGTEALGAEVFASDTEERVVYHTCKSGSIRVSQRYFGAFRCFSWVI